MDLNAIDAAAAVNGEPAIHRDVLRIAPRTRPNGHGGMAVYCPTCNRSDVELVHVQVGTRAPGGLITHRINVTTGEAAANDGTPVAGYRSAASQQTRVALTFGCVACGHDWSTIFPQEAGTTYVYDTAPTIER